MNEWVDGWVHAYMTYTALHSYVSSNHVIDWWVHDYVEHARAHALAMDY